MTKRSIGHPRQLSFLDFGSAARGADPNPAAPTPKLEDDASEPSASRLPSDLPTIRNGDAGAGEQPTCAGAAAAAAPSASEDRSSRPASCPGLQAAAATVGVRSFAAQDRACDGRPSVSPSVSSSDEASAGLPNQTEASPHGAPATKDADGEPRTHVTDPTQGRVDDGSPPERFDEHASRVGDGWNPGLDARARDVETLHASLFGEKGYDATARRRTMGRLKEPAEGSLITRQADHLSALIRKAKKGDLDPLTIAETVMRVDDVSLAEIVRSGPLWLANRLRQGLPHRHTGELREITDPDARARRVHYALGRLKKDNPTDPELPEVDCSVKDAKLSLMPLHLEPPAAKADIRRWGDLSKQERGRETGEGRALDDHTRQTYAYNVRLEIAAANELGLVDASFSVKTLGSRDVASKVFALLDTLFARGIVASMMESLLRMNVDLFLMDVEHTANIEYLQAEATRRFPGLALSAAACLRFENLLSDELKMKTIMGAPRDMMERAHAPSLKPADRVARASKAVVAQLKLESPGLDATQAAALDADVHLRRVDGVLLLQLPDPRERGAVRWDPCTPAAEELVTEWLELKDRDGIEGSLFFPSEDDPAEPQIPRVAMAGLYKDFVAVTGEYLTFDEIKTLRCYKAVMENPTKLRQIAEAACYKDARSLARRLAIVLSRSQGKKAA